MAIQVTGLFKNPKTSLIHESPLLILVPRLEAFGIINMDVHVKGNGQTGVIRYRNIDRLALTYDSQIADTYTRLIDALETFVIDDVSQSNTINQSSTFTKYTPA
jgi:hypothetical protein